MFKKGDDNYQSSSDGGGATIIAEGVKVEGNFVSRGSILIEGMVKGSIKTDQDLKVGEKAKISANIVASNALIAGEIQGNLKVTGVLELSPTSKILGDLEAKTLVVSAGAVINGKCLMTAEAPREILEKESFKDRAKMATKMDAS